MQFYSEAILSRRGPLAKVWLAAHMERKLSKTQTLQTDIEQAADAIMGQEVEVMALRLSGQLLLGVVRIYSRKAKYLLDDCNEALLKIKMAFRPGIVDMTEDQLAVNRNAITLQGNNIDVDLDLLMTDINWDADFDVRPAGQPGGQHVARMADITLAAADEFALDFDDPGYGFDLGPSDGIGSADYDDIDLGLDFGDGIIGASQAGDMESIGVGRDGASERGVSIGSHMLGQDHDFDALSMREPSEHGFGADMNMDVDMTFGADGMDIDLADLGVGFDGEEVPAIPELGRSPSRASSPLTPGPQTPRDDDPQLTPQQQKAPKEKKEKKQIIDSVTELKDGPKGRGLGARVTKDVSGILTEHHFLPRSALVMRLLEIREDPLAHFLPTRITPQGTFFSAAPPGLAPELEAMFLRPVKHGLAAKKRGAEGQGAGANKKPRLDVEGEGDDVDEIEQARRAASTAPSLGFGGDMVGPPGSEGDFMFDDNAGMGMDDFQIPVAEDIDMGGRGKSVSALSELSRLSSPVAEEEGDETYADLACPIASFDLRPSQSSTQTQSQAPGEDEKEAADNEGKGYSKNTVKALGIIRKELQPAAEDDDQEEKVLSFRKLSEKASRRAASSFFFELLVLGTRDCVKLSQPQPFESIEIRAKDKLWERQRHGSVAHSIASGMGL
ncbi:hypothetical protein FIBSPDRAFT_962155 [Athelia psychrophila]|uniref:Rad21/Rec8-like protein N-terminal domain-containing protein n=1 Tax=Athelia psychrophila TaxID=1759441 RepID=A0A166AHY1_9AGAM|nr:hypothetical protein FIBSPDRAFT_962155 [Fibularhizoctonia sp. CBS 109695]